MEKVINSKLLSWYRKNKRNLPWRQTHANNLPDPYFVFVSEYMLQQTTVGTVKTRFEEFILKWPSINDLARISEKTILNFWSGLGYYSRARNLLKAAKIIKKEFNSKIPKNYDDLINFFPFRYVDRSKFYKIKDLPDLQTDVQIIGKVIKKTSVNTKFNKRLTLTFQDDTGQIELIWFRGYNWIEDSIDKNKDYVVFGKLNWYKNKISITHPEIKLKSTFDRNVPRRLHGIYSSTEKLTASGITQRYFIKIIYELLQSTNGKIRENLPEYIRKKYSLIDRQSAFINIHLPESNDKLKKAINRLKFEELFLNQLGFLLSKTDRLEKIDGFKFDVVGDNFNKFYHNSLPFELTGDQKKVIKEIRKDFNSGKQMNRLLQGDVGSGKQ